MSRPAPHALRTTSGAARGGLGLDAVLELLDRRAEPCDVPGEAAGPGLTWDAADRDDPRWNPQGVAALRGGEVLLVAWYGRRERPPVPHGVRVSVVDRRDPSAPRYGHVRLVVRRGGLLRPLRVHAGGLAVSGGLLLVADTVAGVRGFRLDDVLQRGGELVLPQSARLRVPWWRTGRFRFSWLSVGDVDGEPSLVAGEYRRAGSRPLMVRWPLDRASGLPVVGPDGWCAPVDVVDVPVRAQGVTLHGSTWWVSASAGRTVCGDLHVGRPGAFVRHRGVLPPGPEDLDWSVPGEELWCATEWPGARWVFPLDARRWV